MEKEIRVFEEVGSTYVEGYLDGELVYGRLVAELWGSRDALSQTIQDVEEFLEAEAMRRGAAE